MPCRPTQLKLCGVNTCEICKPRSFASHEKSKYWDYNKNDKIPLQIRKGNKNKFWFNCNVCNFNFKISIEKICSRNQWCQHCANVVLCEDDSCLKCFNNSFASVEKSKYWLDRNNKTPRQVRYGTNKKYWFNCDECKHDFKIRIAQISKRDSWCHYCSGTKLCKNNDCTYCFNRSFASNSFSKNWSSKNKKIPREILKCTGKSYIFYCDTCKHEFKTVISSIHNGGGCLYCANFSSALCDNFTCMHCYNKSFASHEKSLYWNFLLNKLSPRQVFKQTDKSYNFICPTCKHNFTGILNGIVANNQWCPYCCKPCRTVCDDTKCIQCYNKSFESHPLKLFWSDKNDKIPRNVVKSSSIKFWFICKFNHDFKMNLYNIVFKNQWCPLCFNKTEGKLLAYLQYCFKNVKHQAKFDWCKNKTHLPFDFLLEDYNILIELDGLQHFKQISNWKSPEHNQERDRFKEEQAVKNGYTIIRIFQEDVFNDKNNWKVNLYSLIYKRKTPIVRYVGKIYKQIIPTSWLII